MAGRETKLTPELQKQVCDMLRLGNTRRVAAAVAGITERTLYRWLAQGQSELEAGNEDGEFCQFCQSLTRAEAECQARNVAAIEKAAFGYKTQSVRTKTKRYEEFVNGPDGKPLRDKRGRPVKRIVTETETVVTDGQEFAYQAAIELLKRRFRSEWGDSIDVRKLDDETIIRLLARDAETGSGTPGPDPLGPRDPEL